MRKFTALIAAGLLAVGLVFGTPSIAQAKKKPTPIAVSPTTPQRGVVFTVAGKMPTKVARPVALQFKSGKKWTTLATAKTTKRGAYSIQATTEDPSLTLRVVAKKVKIKKKTYKKIVTKAKSITTVMPTTPVITTQLLPLAAVTVSYPGQLTVIGGGAPYTWTVAGLPNGLILNPATGAITGTATVAGTYSVSATVTDSLGQTASRAYSLVVGPTSQLYAAGSAHSCAVTTSGEVSCWGNNGSGRLGDGTVASRPFPTKVKYLSRVVAVAAGAAHTCALKADHTVVCWGSNTKGQLGDNSTTPRFTPVRAGSLNLVTAIAAGGSSTCALGYLGRPYCWGANSRGQLGDNSKTDRHVPTAAGVKSVAQISLGNAHACVILSNGTPECWGANSSSQLGDGTVADRLTPTAVKNVTLPVTKIAAGGSHTCVITSTSHVQCWGNNSSGQLGNGGINGSPTPQLVTNSSGTVALTAGNAHTCLVTSTGAAKCWGSGSFGQVGDGSNNRSVTPTGVAGLGSGVTVISAGGYHTLAVQLGVLKAWGNNTSGQLGNGSNQTSPTPVIVGSLG
jgi:alpha-tubulin suppressor-like RCC1 family protein